MSSKEAPALVEEKGFVVERSVEFVGQADEADFRSLGATCTATRRDGRLRRCCESAIISLLSSPRCLRSSFRLLRLLRIPSLLRSFAGSGASGASGVLFFYLFLCRVSRSLRLRNYFDLPMTPLMIGERIRRGLSSVNAC